MDRGIVNKISKIMEKNPDMPTDRLIAQIAYDHEMSWRTARDHVKIAENMT